MTPKTHHDLWPEAADSRHSTAHARSQGQGERDRLTGLHYRKNGSSLLARREGGGVGRGLNALPGKHSRIVAGAQVRGES